MDQLLTGKLISGSYSHPLGRLTTPWCLPRNQRASAGKGPGHWSQADLGSNPGSGSGWLLDPGQVIPL